MKYHSKSIFLFSFLFALSFFSEAQISGIINTYASVTAIDAPNRTITFANVIDPTNGTSTADFAVGRMVMLIQMKGATINTANNATYGSLVVNGINAAGNYEWARVVACGTCTSSQIRLETLRNTYNIGGSVQLVSVPEYINVTVLAAGIQARDWNTALGRGGIVVLSASGTVTLNGNITAIGAGFRGGVMSPTSAGRCADQTTFRSTDTGFGQKGEGIANYPAEMYAKGALMNGGGGGNDHNGGGGGGSNFSAGGNGGNGWNGACSFVAGGLYGGVGGYSLQTFYNLPLRRMFLGGGGGGGQQNNVVGGAGGNGGGIIFIDANTLAIPATCSVSYSINASGQNGADAVGNDGAGGAGAGGAIILRVNNYSLPCVANPLLVRVNGGNGGNVNHTAVHGGGGGGGLGAIVLTTPTPANMNVNSSPGTPGLDCNGACTATGTAGGACFISQCHSLISSDPLPIQLLYFNVIAQKNKAILKWGTQTEKNVKYFEIQKSLDLQNIEKIGVLDAKGNSNTLQNYIFTDTQIKQAKQYYRIKSIDFDGTEDYSPWEMFEADLNLQDTFKLYPNPTQNQINITLEDTANIPKTVYLYDFSGKIVLTQTFEETTLNLSLAHLAKGLYLIQIVYDNHILTDKIILQ